MSRETRNMNISTSTFDIERVNEHLQHEINAVLRKIVEEYLDEIDESFEFVNFSHLCENAINYKRIKYIIAARILKDYADKQKKEEPFEDYEDILHIPGYKTVKVLRRLE